MVPGGRLAIAHGQMDESELETMLTFSNGEADILVCTTIIDLARHSASEYHLD